MHTERGLELRVFVAKHDHVGAPQRGERLTQPSHRQQTLAKIAAVHDHDVQVARQLAMLKSIVQQMDALSSAFAFGQQAGFMAAGSDVNRHSGRTRDQQGFIPKSICAPADIDALCRLLGSPVASG